VTVVHNTIATPTLASGSGIYVYAGTVLITDNIVSNYDTALERAGGTVSEDYNLFYGASSDLVGTITSGGHSVPSSLGKDPSFVDASGGNYRLNDNSAAVDIGIDAGIYDDYDHNPRPGDGTPFFDAGAFELQGVGTCAARVNDLPTIYDTPQQAVDAAQESDLIKLSGTCQGMATRNGLTQILYITKSLIIEGGYLPDFSDLDPANPRTRLDAGGQGRGIVIIGDIDVEIVNIELVGGDAAAGGAINDGEDGGGLYIRWADVTLTNSHVSGNQAGDTGNGGNIYVGSLLTIGPGVVISNGLAYNGGGVFINSMAPTVTGVLLNGGSIVTNTATNHGGGVYVDDAGAVFTQTAGIVGNNTATDSGGGVYINAGTGLWTGGQVYSNTAYTGGGIYVNGGDLTLVDTDIVDNRAFNHAGGAYVAGSTFVTRGRFEGNESGNEGGGIRTLSGLWITDTVFISNTAALLGGGANSGGSAGCISSAACR